MYCICDEDFKLIVKLMGNRNRGLAERLSKLEPTVKQLSKRTIKIKEDIKNTLQELIREDKPLKKYQVHKRTNIAYVTINKYFVEIKKEVENENS